MIRRRRRGAVLIWFTGVFLTTFTFVGLISVDYGHVIYARSEIRAVATDAALQAARQYQEDPSSEQAPLLLDETAARDAVAAAVQSVTDLKILRKTTITATKVTFENNEPGNELWFEQPPSQMRVPRVVVSITYEIRDLSLLDLGLTLLGEADTTLSGTITASAVICLPGFNPDTLNGACQRSDA